MPREHKPWWRTDADAHKSDKLVRLPTDAARWAWFTMGCEAKVQRHMGVFADRAYLRFLLGTYARHLPELERKELVHEWPTDCADCTADYRSMAVDGSMVVHNYRRKQVDPTNAVRQARFRERHGESHGDGDGESNGDQTPISRALSPSPSWSPSDSPGIDEPYQVSAPVEPYRTLEDLTHFPVQRVSDRTIQRLDGLCDRRTVPAVIAAMRSVGPSITPQPPSPDQLVYEAIKHLEPFSNGRKPAMAAKGGVSDEEAERAFGRA